MKIGNVKETVFQIIEMFFTGATITYGNQSYKTKPSQPLVTVTFGNTQRVQHPPKKTVDGHVVAYYPSYLHVQVDLYTKGAIVTNTSGGTIGKENTALSDMVDFANFLHSPYMINHIEGQNITIGTEGNVMDTTHLLSSSDFQFRSTIELKVHFTDEVVGYSGMLAPTSIRYPSSSSTAPDGNGSAYEDGNVDGESQGYPEGYNPEEDNTEEDYTENDFEDEDGEDYETDTPDEETYVTPEFEQNPSGGGNEEIALEILGFFEDADVEATEEDIE